MPSSEYLRLCGLLRERVAEPNSQLAADVAYALSHLSEAIAAVPAMAPEGRAGILTDLRAKAEAATASVHDPAIVNDLIQALTAFLSEELNETPLNEPNGGTMDDKPNPFADEDEEKKPLVPGEEEVPPEDAAAETTAAPPDTTLSPPKRHMPRQLMTCEACGHEMEMMPLMAAMESARTKDPDPDDPDGDEPDDDEPTTLQEAHMHDTPTTAGAAAVPPAAAAPAQPAASVPTPAPTSPQAEARTSLLETERIELLQLRAQERKRQLIREAKVTIKKAGVFLEAAELASFPKEQWPALIRLADQPPRTYGTGPSTLGPGLSGNGHRVRESQVSAADYFDSLYERPDGWAE